VIERPHARWSAVCLLAAGLLVLSGCGSSGSKTGASPVPTGSSTAGTSPTPAAFASPDPTSPACTPTSVGPAYRLETCVLQSPSLAGNLLGDSSLHFYVLTPIDYPTSGLRYPSVYFLTGYTDDASSSARLIGRSEGSADTPPGTVPPIVVTVTGLNAFGGSMYANSPVGGNWEDAITVDLIGYVDAHYRTIGTRESRGLTGHSMGGAGSTNLGMRHPDLFAALYPMSPAVFPASEAAWVLSDSSIVARMLDLEDELSAGKLSQAERLARIEAAVAADSSLKFPFAYGTAYAGDPSSPILMRFPFRRVNGQAVQDDAITREWNAGWGDMANKVNKQYKAALEQYRAIGVDCGTADAVWAGSHRLVKLLQGAGIAVEENSFNGGHVDQVDDRILNHMLPFMAEHLADR
jgi:S-formylglutathione hydrolase